MGAGDGARLHTVPKNRLLVAACHAMGVSDVETYGSLDNDEGPLVGLLR